MAVDHRDLYRSVMSDFAGRVAPDFVANPDKPGASSSLTSWFDGELISFEPYQDQRNADFVGRGTFRFRGFYRSGLGVKVLPAKVAEQPHDERWRLAAKIQEAIRGRDILVMDYASGTGQSQIGVVMFSEAPASIVEPIEGVGIVLVQAEFWLS